MHAAKTSETTDKHNWDQESFMLIQHEKTVIHCIWQTKQLYHLLV